MQPKPENAKDAGKHQKLKKTRKNFQDCAGTLSLDFYFQNSDL